jgi:hypothetical protein
MQKPQAGEGVLKVFFHPGERTADDSPARSPKSSNASRVAPRLCRSAFLKHFFRELHLQGAAAAVSDGAAQASPTGRRVIRDLKLFP